MKLNGISVWRMEQVLVTMKTLINSKGSPSTTIYNKFITLYLGTQFTQSQMTSLLRRAAKLGIVNVVAKTSTLLPRYSINASMVASNWQNLVYSPASAQIAGTEGLGVQGEGPAQGQQTQYGNGNLVI